MDNILFFSCEAGGAEVLIPVITLLKQSSFNITVLAYGYGAERFKRNNISYREISRVEKDNSNFFGDIKPTFIITSAASHPSKDMSEKHIWQIAKEHGIKTVAFLDQWQNYAIRFSGLGKNERLAYMPDYINCLNDIGKLEMLNEGFPGDKLLPFGHPYLSNLVAEANKVDTDRVKKELSLHKNQPVMLFVSEAIREYYELERGYDQYKTLSFFFDSLSKWHDEDYGNVIVKLHPKDDIEKFKSIREKYRHINARFIQSELTPLECVSISDNVYGMTSVMLIEAYILGKRVLSLQPNLKINDPLILSRHGLTKKIVSDHNVNLLGGLRRKNDSDSFHFTFLKDKFLSFLSHELKNIQKEKN